MECDRFAAKNAGDRVVAVASLDERLLAVQPAGNEGFTELEGVDGIAAGALELEPDFAGVLVLDRKSVV